MILCVARNPVFFERLLYQLNVVLRSIRSSRVNGIPIPSKWRGSYNRTLRLGLTTLFGNERTVSVFRFGTQNVLYISGQSGIVYWYCIIRDTVSRAMSTIYFSYVEESLGLVFFLSSIFFLLFFVRGEVKH